MREEGKERKKKTTVPQSGLDWTSRGRKRKQSPRRIAKIFAWTVVSAVAAAMGWESFQPVMQPTWNLTEVMAQRDAQGYLMDLDPDVVVVNWGNKTRCGKSSTPWQCRRGRRELRNSTEEVLFATEVLKWQLGRGRLAWAVAQVKSAVWEAAPSQTLWRPGMDNVTVGRAKVLGTSRLHRAVRDRMAACERQWSVQTETEGVRVAAEGGA